MIPGRGRIRGWLLAFLAGLAATLLLLEIGLRLTSRLYWSTELGVSGRLHPIPDGALTCASCTRILVVGDSYTFGFGAAQGQDYPRVLGQLLDQRAPGRFVVVNGGMGAANSTLARENLASFLDKVKADVVVILAGGSNALNFSRYYAWTWEDPRLATLERWLYEVRILRLARFVWARTHPVLQPHRWDQDLFAVARRAALDRGLAWYQASPDRVPGPVQSDFTAAIRALEQGDTEGALQRIARVQQGEPGFGGARWAEAMARLGGSMMWSRDVEVILQEAIRLSPSDPNGYDALGSMYFQGHNPHGAGQWYQAGIQAVPDHAGLHCGLGNVLALTDQYVPAMDALEKGIRLDPDDARCYPALGQISRQLGRQGATSDLLLGFPDSAMARNLGSMLHDERRTASAWMRSDLEAMVDMARAAGARPVLQSYPNANEANPILEDVAHDEDVPFVDQYAAFAARLAQGTAPSALFIPDGHCNGDGYALMGQTLLEGLLGAGVVDPSGRSLP